VARQGKRLAQAELTSPFDQQRPVGIVHDVQAHQRIEIDQVTHPVGEFGILEQVRRAVEDLIQRIQHMPAGPRRLSDSGQQQIRIHVHAGHRRQDVVVQIEFQAVLRVAHRWRLVAPLAVVLRVVIIQRQFVPASGCQTPLCIRQRRQRNQNVDVGRQASATDRQALRDVGTALEQHAGVRCIEQCDADAFGGPLQRPRLPTCEAQLGREMARGRFGHPVHARVGGHRLGEPSQQPQPAAEPDDPLPLRKRPASHAFRLAQRSQPGPSSPARLAHDSSASCDDARMAGHSRSSVDTASSRSL
jgi:hypothetical protein